ncbi:MarR family transcriptional regulator [Catenulispora sp. NF23]|uniref:MarR family winged helix-turn-helix transcriptional regulator n=1 Tax=Catenulispora pinistramenti TaxID=2705254 RepID=UPI001BAA5217|nr:MarR family transcriptional regulator [Catenulispora pinistramenti]MBS2538928.1 MarR family transcriptional regulator [Catenulispora pinistramenti]
MPTTKPRWLDDDEMRAWLAYRRMRLLLSAEINRDLARDSGLSEADYDVLSNLTAATTTTRTTPTTAGTTPTGAADRRRLSELAAHMQWSKSRLSHHITRMEQRGLVRREEVDGDARGSFVVLTTQGRETIERAAPHHVHSVRRHLIDRLSPEQIRVLGEIGDVVLGPLEGEGIPED